MLIGKKMYFDHTFSDEKMYFDHTFSAIMLTFSKKNIKIILLYAFRFENPEVLP